MLQIGYEAHLINEELLGLLTIVALATTLMTTPLLKLTGWDESLQQPLPLSHDPAGSAARAPADAVAGKEVGHEREERPALHATGPGAARESVNSSR